MNTQNVGRIAGCVSRNYYGSRQFPLLDDGAPMHQRDVAGSKLLLVGTTKFMQMLYIFLTLILTLTSRTSKFRSAE
jgi:hypothetical protein